MSLVAYEYSDDSADEENDSNNQINETINCANKVHAKENTLFISKNNSTTENTNEENLSDDLLNTRISSGVINFNAIPKPRSIDVEEEIIEEVCFPSMKEIELRTENPSKNKGPVKISIPSLSNFKDIEEEENRKNKSKIKPSQKGTSLFAILPPPRSETKKQSSRILVPHVLTKKIPETKTLIQQKPLQTTQKPKEKIKTTRNILESSNYDSHSDDDEEDANKDKIDFFSLTTPSNVLEDTDVFKIRAENEKLATKLLSTSKIPDVHTNETEQGENIVNVTTGTTAFSLGKEDILLKNKVEVGPKLPVPEQEYNLDDKGNVAFDEKAIEYLCGKRGVKRKNKELESMDIIEINGEDIKPDEREWLVKALTEQPVQRPVSLGAGPSSQSKKKHQITYLAHQAKAMEIELQNQWAQNKMTRKQTQSKYGF